MAEVDFYQNELKKLLTDPSSFRKTPGFEFALNTGLEAVNRSNSRMRNSGNAMTALTQYGTGLASQEYANQADRLARILGQEQQYGLGQGQLDLGNRRLDLDAELGRGQLNLGQERLDLDALLGRGQLDNARRANDQQFGLGMFRAQNDFTLGSQQNANTAQNNWWNYNLGAERNATDRAQGQNAFNLGNRAMDIDWFNAQTQRGRAQGEQWERQQQYRDPWSWY